MKRFLLGFVSVTSLFLLLTGLLFAAVTALRCVQLFNVPASSMMPTLLVGDHFVTNNAAYGVNVTADLPLRPFLLFQRSPERGDVVAFRSPTNMMTIYVKRLVGLPGDKIRMSGGELHLNGKPVLRERRDDLVETENGRTTRVAVWRETLPNGVSYDTLDRVPNGLYDTTETYVVPLGHVFVLGDNRDNSTDSRALFHMGYVPSRNLIGKATFIYTSGQLGRMFTWVR